MGSKGSDHGMTNFAKLSKLELQELLQKQNAFLQNKKFILKLPDKGAKIEAFKNKIEEELRAREFVDDAAMELEKLRLDDKDEEPEVEIPQFAERLFKYENVPKKEKFRPNSTTKAKSPSELDEIFHQNKGVIMKRFSWEDSALAPFKVKHPPKVLTMKESVKQLKDDHEKFLELEVQRAVEKLSERINVPVVESSSSVPAPLKYRDRIDSDDSCGESED